MSTTNRSSSSPRVSVVRTLNLPRDFQLVLRRRDVRKVDATRGFGVRHRLHAGFWVGVRSVSHTARAFAKYVLHRLKKFLEKLEPVSAVAVRFPSFTVQPLLFPPIGCVLYVVYFFWRLLLARVQRKRRRRNVGTPGDVFPVRRPRFGEKGYDPAIVVGHRVKPKPSLIDPKPVLVHRYLEDFRSDP